VSIFEGQARSYILLQEVLIAQKKNSLALEIAERGRTRAFVELLATRFYSLAQSTIHSLTLEEIQQIASFLVLNGKPKLLLRSSIPKLLLVTEQLRLPSCTSYARQGLFT
jgi:hypothetical protein